MSTLYVLDHPYDCEQPNSRKGIVGSPLGMFSMHPLKTLATVSATLPVVLSSRPEENNKEKKIYIFCCFNTNRKCIFDSHSNSILYINHI